MYRKTIHHVMKRMICGFLAFSLVNVSVLHAQSDLDIIRAIVARDLNKVRTYCKRTDPNQRYGKEGYTVLMVALNEFEKSLTRKSHHQRGTSCVNHAWKFASGTGIFGLGAGISAMSAMLLRQKINEPEIGGTTQEAQNAAVEYAPLLHEGDHNESAHRFNIAWEWVRSWWPGSSDADADTGSQGGSPALSPRAFEVQDDASWWPAWNLNPFSNVLQNATGLAGDARPLVNDARFIIRVITPIVLLGGVSAGIGGMAKGAPQALDGLSKGVARPFQSIFCKYELIILKKIIFTLLRQEQIDVMMPNNDGETALEMVQRFMLEHIHDQEEYNHLAEIEQFIKVRQIVS